MSKELLQVNLVSGGSLIACFTYIEPILACIVLTTALYINIRNIIRSKNEDNRHDD
jgi:hypothetical protein